MSDLRQKFGELLKLERERKGIKLEDLAEQLKISQSHLEAIESGDISNLPSELYYGLFVKSYSEAIGIDYTATMEAMRAELEEAPETEDIARDGAPTKRKVRSEKTAEAEADTEAEEIDDSSGIMKWLLYIFGGLALLFVVFLAVNYFFFSGKSTTSEPSTTEQEQAKAEESSQSPQAINAGVASFNWSDTVGYEVPPKLKLSLVAIDQSWATILADGDTALFRNLVPGRQYDIEADYRMLVSIGIPSVVRVRLNGQPVELADQQSGRISRVKITQANLYEFLTPRESKTDSPAATENKPEQKINDQTPKQPQQDTKMIDQTPEQPQEGTQTDTVEHGGTGDGN